MGRSLGIAKIVRNYSVGEGALTPPIGHRKVVTVCEPVLIMTDQDNRTSGGPG
jgi:hypothetical protein